MAVWAELLGEVGAEADVVISAGGEHVADDLGIKLRGRELRQGNETGGGDGRHSEADGTGGLRLGEIAIWRGEEITRERGLGVEQQSGRERPGQILRCRVLVVDDVDVSVLGDAAEAAGVIELRAMLRGEERV